MAQQEHLIILRRGVRYWNWWREQNPDIIPDLSGADLKGIDLSQANLSSTNLEGADLQEANLEGADLQEANLRNANLKQTNLNRATLNGAIMKETIVDLTIEHTVNIDLQTTLYKNTSFEDIHTNLSEGKVRGIRETKGIKDTNIRNKMYFNKVKSNNEFREVEEYRFESATEPLTPVSSPLLTRYPNIECPEETRIAQPFTLCVKLLLKSIDPNVPPIKVSPIDIEDTGTRQLPEVEIFLWADNFDLQGSNTQVIQIEREKDSNCANFVLIPRQGGEQQIRVDFYQKGKRIGTIRRNILVVDVQNKGKISQPNNPLSIELKTNLSVPPPDLELWIKFDRHNNNTLIFTLFSRKKSMDSMDYNGKSVGQVTLQKPPDEKMWFVYHELSEYARKNARTFEFVEETESSPIVTANLTEQAVERLNSIGKKLWDELIPDDLKREYWKFQSNVKTLVITSDEPWIPWEMIKPYEKETQKDAPFWCEQFAISRWLWLNGIVSADELPAKVVAPVAPKQVNLPSVTKEITFLQTIQELRTGISINKLISNSLELIKYLKDPDFSILHFACHGGFDVTLPNDSAIQFADGDLLRPSDIHLFYPPHRPRPLIFINACHGGRVGFSFTGLGGWAETLIEARVGAFVGAMWEVNDTLALEFAKQFYRGLLQENLTIAEAFNQARKAIRQLAPGNSTWLAYSLYADPEARLV